MPSPAADPNFPTPAPRSRPSCLVRLLGFPALALLVGVGAWVWDALVEAPWAHSLANLVGHDQDGRGTLTGPWLGEFTSSNQRLHGILALQIERRQWGSSGRTRGVTGPSYPDFNGSASLCGLAADPKSTGQGTLWGYANRDGSLVHAIVSLAPGYAWDLSALNGAWNRDAGTLRLVGQLKGHAGAASGGAPVDARQPITITLTRSTDQGSFEQRCAGLGSTLRP